jgi:hypothetical protein
MSGNSAPGSASYASNTLNVGDGTWDAGLQSFLLPNLVGLNFATMQYNGEVAVLLFDDISNCFTGMANRFQGLTEYHKLVLGHGVLAAITFLFIVPAAIFIARFHYPPPQAVQYHIYLHILTVLLTTIIVVLGWFSVGPGRSLTNPHHGIGIAIYVLVLFQVMYGWLVRKLQRGRQLGRVSIKMMVCYNNIKAKPKLIVFAATSVDW